MGDVLPLELSRRAQLTSSFVGNEAVQHSSILSETSRVGSRASSADTIPHFLVLLSGEIRLPVYVGREILETQMNSKYAMLEYRRQCWNVCTVNVGVSRDVLWHVAIFLFALIAIT